MGQRTRRITRIALPSTSATKAQTTRNQDLMTERALAPTQTVAMPVVRIPRSLKRRNLEGVVTAKMKTLNPDTLSGTEHPSGRRGETVRSTRKPWKTMKKLLLLLLHHIRASSAIRKHEQSSLNRGSEASGVETSKTRTKERPQIGGETAAGTETGTGRPKLKQILNGWTPPSKKNPLQLTHRKNSSAGRSV